MYKTSTGGHKKINIPQSESAAPQRDSNATDFSNRRFDLLRVVWGGRAHLGGSTTSGDWLAGGALPHTPAVWRGVEHSSAAAAELGNVPSAYSPHSGRTPLLEEEKSRFSRLLLN